MTTRPARASRSLGRLSEIAQVAARHGFGYFLRRNRLGDLLPGGNGRDGDAAATDRGRRLREMLDELGPTFVKFGQLLSTRPDVVPPDIVIELRGLQDHVTPFPFEQVREMIEAELGLTVEQAFVELDEVPIASASIGQVHRAVLPDGQEVAVKVQRPVAARQIEADLGLLYQAAKLLRERVRALEFIDPQELVDEFARSIRLELDYAHEARNADAFHRNFAHEDGVVVPRVIRQYSTGRVLTLEYLRGTKVSELDLAGMAPEARRDVAYRMADTWMTMVFRHGFFHSDPHPANIFVLDSGELGLVDFGQAGKLTDEDMTKLTRLFVDGATENIDAIPRRLRELGVRYAPEREQEFRDELRVLFDRYYGTRLSDIDPLQVIREGFQLIYALNLRLPSRFVMLDKAIATLASVGAEVYPDFNVFEVAKPYARGLLADRYQPRMVAQRARTEALALGSIARELPYQAHDVLERMRDGTFQIRFDNPGLDELDDHIDQASNRLSVALVVLGGLLGSSIVGVFAREGPHVIGLHVLSFIGFVVSGAFGLWLIWGVLRHGRL
ncbi:MAG: AarF/ABC1/UbiB kinase family protein [Actinobacteria bacterium]|nr:AarF/ABC1/UbiB kinase family protein [Actinomycetota bacterium]